MAIPPNKPIKNKILATELYSASNIGWAEKATKYSPIPYQIAKNKMVLYRPQRSSAMYAPSKDGFWHNVKEALITFCQDPPEDTTTTPVVGEPSSVISQTSKRRRRPTKTELPLASSLASLDTAISLHQKLDTVAVDINIMSSNDFQHHIRRMLITQDRVNLKNLETIVCRQIEVEQELKEVKTKLKKELAELAEQAGHVTQLVISNRLNLMTILETQIQTSGRYQPLIDLQDDLQGKISACTDPKDFLEGIRVKIENDGKNYKRFDYSLPYSFEKIPPLAVSQNETKTVEPLSPIGTELENGSTEHALVETLIEHAEVGQPSSR